jgi:hypothetical protein
MCVYVYVCMCMIYVCINHIVFGRLLAYYIHRVHLRPYLIDVSQFTWTRIP